MTTTNVTVRLTPPRKELTFSVDVTILFDEGENVEGYKKAIRELENIISERRISECRPRLLEYSASLMLLLNKIRDEL